MPWMHRRDRLPPNASKAARSLDFPIAFRVRGAASSTSATLMQLGLGGCRLRTWRIMPVAESIEVEIPQEDCSAPLLIGGSVRERTQISANVFEYTIDLAPLEAREQDRLAREAALLVRRRHLTRLRAAS